MLVYYYDEETKEFLYSEEAPLDPLETELKGEEVYLLPANATFDEPLEKEEGKVVVFDGKKWTLEEIPQEEIDLIPEYPPTKEDIKLLRASLYRSEVDPLMSKYTRKKTFNLFEGNEEAELLAKIEDKVAEIKARYPYPEEAVSEIEVVDIVD